MRVQYERFQHRLRTAVDTCYLLLKRGGPAAFIANVPFRSMAMASQTQQRSKTPNSTVLAAVLDKLVAVHLDLDLLCGTSADRARATLTPKAIADACDILQSAIADLRNIIHQVDGPKR